MAKEIYSTGRQIHSTTDIDEDKKIIKLWFLRELLSSISHPLESNNSFLDEGKMSINVTDLDNLSFYDALICFLDNHYFYEPQDVSLLPVVAIKKLLYVSFSIIESLSKHQLLDTQKIELDFMSAQKIMQAHKDFLYGMAAFTDTPVGFIDVSPRNLIELSSGEKAVLDLLSRFHFSIQEIKKRESNAIGGDTKNFPTHFCLLLDEGDMGFHPVWKKKYVKTIVDVLPKFFEQFQNSTVQIIFTTHDPLTLSDMPNKNVVYMKKEKDFCKVLQFDDSMRPKSSFGANISTLLSDSFFVDDGLVGEFAIQKIDKTIEWINDPEDMSNVDYHEKVIEIIDELLLKKKLAEMFAEKTGRNSLERKVIDEQIKILEQRKNKIQKNL
ncbi:hypothetical protein [Haliscomenobacter sp.]|uniref:hypothetical protein n=1 Tax=Haliscomenobacter sp. TaxID=2717303 RepID=UPI00359466F3